MPAEERSFVHRFLALYLADHGDRERAVEMTSRELETRKDLGGYDAYAWCTLPGRPRRDAAVPMSKAPGAGHGRPSFRVPRRRDRTRRGRSPGRARPPI